MDTYFSESRMELMQKLVMVKRHPLAAAPADMILIDKYKSAAPNLVSLTLSHRQLCDLELLLNGGFAPLNGFMNQADYQSVLQHMRLTDGSLWPMPITLDVDKAFAESIASGQEIALRDSEGLLLAILHVGDIWPVDRAAEAQAVFGTTDDTHPSVAYLNHYVKDYYVGGKVFGISLPQVICKCIGCMPN